MPKQDAGERTRQVREHEGGGHASAAGASEGEVMDEEPVHATGSLQGDIHGSSSVVGKTLVHRCGQL